MMIKTASIESCGQI